MTPTTEHSREMTMRISSVIALLAGIWLFVSPWVYRVYMDENAWNSWIVGAVIVILAAIRLGQPAGTVALSWINCLLGIWAFVSPWAYGYTHDTGRFINSLCVGVIVFLAAIGNAARTQHPSNPMPTHM